MDIIQIQRVFSFNGMELDDPNPALSEEDVKDFYAGLYPSLNNAYVKSAEPQGDKVVISFVANTGTKG